MPLTIRLVMSYMVLAIGIGVAAVFTIGEIPAWIWVICHTIVLLLLLRRRSDYYIIILVLFWIYLILALVGMVLTAAFQKGLAFTLAAVVAGCMGGCTFLLSLKESKDWLRKRRRF